MREPDAIEEELGVNLEPSPKAGLMARIKALLISDKAASRSEELDEVILTEHPSPAPQGNLADDSLTAKLRPLDDNGQLQRWLQAERQAPLFEQYERQARLGIMRANLGVVLGIAAFLVLAWVLQAPYWNVLQDSLGLQEPGVRQLAGGQIAQLAAVVATLIFPLLCLYSLMRGITWLLGARRPARAIAALVCLLGLLFGLGALVAGQALMACALALSGVVVGELIERWWRGGR